MSTYLTHTTTQVDKVVRESLDRSNYLKQEICGPRWSFNWRLFFGLYTTRTEIHNLMHVLYNYLIIVLFLDTVLLLKLKC